MALALLNLDTHALQQILLLRFSHDTEIYSSDLLSLEDISWRLG